MSFKNFLNPVVLLAIFAVIGLLIFILSVPDEKKKNRVEKKPREQVEKNWQEVVSKLEKHIHFQKAEIEKLKLEDKSRLRDLMIEKAKVTKLQEKILQEKEWLQKDQDALTKKERESIALKESLIKTEKDVEAEHFLKLKLERELKEAKNELEVLAKEKKESGLRLTKAEAELEYYKNESAQQKKINAQLAKKNEENEWISKTEYEKLQKIIQEKEKELERALRNRPLNPG